MELKEVLQNRRSVRRFTEESVCDEHIEELLQAAMSGPSACNRCPWEFFVVTNKETLELLRGASRFTKMNAPLAIVVCGNLSRALPLQLSSFWIQDCSAATENILLRATDLSLGAVWCGVYPQKRVQDRVTKILNLKDKWIPLNIIWIGYPDENPDPRVQYDAKRVHYVK